MLHPGGRAHCRSSAASAGPAAAQAPRRQPQPQPQPSRHPPAHLLVRQHVSAWRGGPVQQRVLSKLNEAEDVTNVEACHGEVEALEQAPRARQAPQAHPAGGQGEVGGVDWLGGLGVRWVGE